MSQAREALDNTDQRVDIAVQLLLSNQRLLNHLEKFQNIEIRMGFIQSF